MRSKEVVETTFIRGLQNVDNYDTLNKVDIKIDTYKI